MHFGVISANLRTNSVYTPAEAERYNKGIIRRIKTVSDRVTNIVEVLRTRKQPVRLASLEHWHPLIRAVLITKFRKSKEPLLREVVHGVKPVIPKNPKEPSGARPKFRGPWR